MTKEAYTANFDTDSLAKFRKAAASGYHGQIPRYADERYGVKYSSASDQAPFIWAVVQCAPHSQSFMAFFMSRVDALHYIADCVEYSESAPDRLVLRLGLVK